MDKFSFITLWDTYNGLLTPTQQEITDLYFNKDLTVSEIASEKNVTRQAVSECLKGCKKQLEEYEERLHIAQKLNETEKKAEDWAERFKAAHPEFSGEVDELKNMLRR